MTGDPNETVDSESIRRVTLIPFRVDEHFEMESMFTHWLPWSAPGMMGALGRTKSRPDTVSSFVGFEWPFQHIVATERMTKRDLERIHLDRFVTDFIVLTNQPPFVDINQSEEGKDPPDFTISDLEGRYGLDCAQLTVASRRPVHAAFQVIRDALLSEPRERFAHLAGHVVYMWFGGGSNDMQLPPRPGKGAEVQAIVDALATYRVDPEAFTYKVDHPDDGLPERLENTKFDSSQPGTAFYAVLMQAAVPSTMFFLRTGFEIGMSYTTKSDVGSLWEELRRLIDTHDKAVTQHLLITIGGPDRNEFTFPAETYLLDTALAVPRSLNDIKHLVSVTLHFWNTGKVVTLHPTHQSSRVIYPGHYSPAFFSAMTSVSDQPRSSFQWLVVRENEAETDGSSSQ